MTGEQAQGWSGHAYFTLDDLAAMLPGLGRVMSEVGQRYWKLYYAAKADNWTLAEFQAKEISHLMEFCTITRPKYRTQLESFINTDLDLIKKAIKAQDWNKFEEAYQLGITNANDYHKSLNKDYIVWKLPDYPPPDLDMTPRKGS